MIMHKRFATALAFAAALFTAACTEEGPTDVGDALLPSGDVVTFEVLLPASDFLVNDTSFSGYYQPVDAAFAVIAQDHDNTVDANMLLRMSLPPRFIVVRTTGTTMVNDSSPRFFAGRLVVRLDTLRAGTKPVFFRLFRTAEEWNHSATWTHRIDTLNARLPWATPGGTRGAQVDTATWTAGDSVVFDVDSATLAVWADSTNNARGAILVAETSGAFVRSFSTTLRVSTHSSLRADTVVNVDLVPTIRTFVFNPALASPNPGMRVGGIPTWRTFLRLREDLRSLVIPCTNGPANCRVSLDSVRINKAELLLTTMPAPSGFAPEDSVMIETRSLLTSAQVPIERSPVQNVLARSDLIAPSAFRTGTSGQTVRLDMTGLLVHLLDESVTPANRLPALIGLLQIPETNTFGLASFRSDPVLRLVLTTNVEGQ